MTLTRETHVTLPSDEMVDVPGDLPTGDDDPQWNHDANNVTQPADPKPRDRYDDRDISDLERLRRDTKDKVRPPHLLTVPGNEDYVLAVRADLQYTELEEWQRISQYRGGRKGVNPRRFCGLVLANCTLEIRWQNRVMVGDSGTVTFASDEMMELYGVGTAADAAAAFCGTDGALFSLAGAVQIRNGYDGEVQDAVDPTNEQ